MKLLFLLSSSFLLVLSGQVIGMGHTDTITSNHAQKHMHQEVERHTHDNSGIQRKLAFLNRNRGEAKTATEKRYQMTNGRRRTLGHSNYMHTVEVAQSYNSRDEELIERLVELQN